MSSVRVFSTESATDQTLSSFFTPLPGAGMMSRDRGINRSAKGWAGSHILSRARIYAAKALDIMTRTNPIPAGAGFFSAGPPAFRRGRVWAAPKDKAYREDAQVAEGNFSKVPSKNVLRSSMHFARVIKRYPVVISKLMSRKSDQSKI